MRQTTKFFSRCGLMVVLILPSFSAMACDSCGCFMGITPYDNQSSITLLHSYRSFGGYHGQKHPLFPGNKSIFKFNNQTNAPITQHNGNPNDYEIYRTLEVRARYFLSKRIEFNAS